MLPASDVLSPHEVARGKSAPRWLILVAYALIASPLILSVLAPTPVRAKSKAGKGAISTSASPKSGSSSAVSAVKVKKATPKKVPSNPTHTPPKRR